MVVIINNRQLVGYIIGLTIGRINQRQYTYQNPSRTSNLSPNPNRSLSHNQSLSRNQSQILGWEED